MSLLQSDVESLVIIKMLANIAFTIQSWYYFFLIEISVGNSINYIF